MADFNMIIGVWCLLLSVISILAMGLMPFEPLTLLSPDLTSTQVVWFFIATVLLGIFASYFGTFFWHRASATLPVTIAGQIIVAETCSGLLYTYLHQQRLPRWYEMVGFIFVIGGVLLSIRKIQAYQRQELVEV